MQALACNIARACMNHYSLETRRLPPMTIVKLWARTRPTTAKFSITRKLTLYIPATYL